MDNASEIVAAHQPCPDCGSHDALAVYSDGSTYCFSCETAHKNVTDTRIEESVSSKVGHNLIPPSDMTFESLKSRCLEEATCRKYGYYVTKYNGQPCQVACYYDDSGNMVGQKLRFKDKQFSVLGKISKRFFGQHLFNSGKRLVVTEGEIDCLTVSQIGGNRYPVVSIPNGCTSAKKIFNENLEWLSNFEEVIVMFDMDEPGRKAVEDVCRILPYGKLKIANLPLKDPNECLMAHRAGAVLFHRTGLAQHPAVLFAGRCHDRGGHHVLYSGCRDEHDPHGRAGGCSHHPQPQAAPHSCARLFAGLPYHDLRAGLAGAGRSGALHPQRYADSLGGGGRGPVSGLCLSAYAHRRS